MLIDMFFPSSGGEFEINIQKGQTCIDCWDSGFLYKHLGKPLKEEYVANLIF